MATSFKKIAIQYAIAKAEITVPNNANVITYGSSDFPDIHPHKTPTTAVKNALKHPIGSPSLHQLAKNANKVLIAFDDPVKKPEAIKTTIPVILDELGKCGVNDADIKLISANGTHCKWKPNELKSHLGEDVYNRFRPYSWDEGNIINHDCLKGNVTLGVDPLGGAIEYNKLLIESDLVIYAGTVFPLPYGGYGGQGTAIGLAGQQSMNALHSYEVFRTSGSLHANWNPEANHFRKHKLASHLYLEEAIGKKVFYVDAVTGPLGVIVDVFAGYVPELENVVYSAADKIYNVNVKQADIIIHGLPYEGMYDTSDNPGMAWNSMAKPLRLSRGKPLLKPNGVVISIGRCHGTISSRRPADVAALKIAEDCFDMQDFYEYSDEFWNHTEYSRQYQHAFAYSPIHSIYVQSNLFAFKQLGIFGILTGDINPGVVRKFGLMPAKNFETALSMATEIVGREPEILILPTYHHNPQPIFNVQ